MSDNKNIPAIDLDQQLLDAAEDGDLQKVKVLIASGVDKDVQCKYMPGTTAIREAIAKGHQDIFDYLLSIGARTDIEDKNGVTAFHFGVELAVCKNKYAIDMVVKMIRAGADITQPIFGGGLPVMHHAAYSGLSDIVDALIERGQSNDVVGVDVFHDNRHCTPLMICCTAPGFIDGALYLLQKGADIDYKTPDGKTAYDVALECKCPETAALILDTIKERQEQQAMRMGKIDKDIQDGLTRDMRVKKINFKP